VKPRRPKPIDVWCPACGAAPWTKCVPYDPGPHSERSIVPGGRSHERRKAVCRRLARELGFPPVRVLVDEYGHFRAAKR